MLVHLCFRLFQLSVATHFFNNRGVLWVEEMAEPGSMFGIILLLNFLYSWSRIWRCTPFHLPHPSATLRWTRQTTHMPNILIQQVTWTPPKNRPLRLQSRHTDTEDRDCPLQARPLHFLVFCFLDFYLLVPGFCIVQLDTHSSCNDVIRIGAS